MLTMQIIKFSKILKIDTFFNRKLKLDYSEFKLINLYFIITEDLS